VHAVRGQQSRPVGHRDVLSRHSGGLARDDPRTLSGERGAE
jgi:hypothetical protein